MNSLYIQNYKGHRDKIEFKTEQTDNTETTKRQKK